jgi:hypothetical protein
LRSGAVHRIDQTRFVLVIDFVRNVGDRDGGSRVTRVVERCLSD